MATSRSWLSVAIHHWQSWTCETYFHMNAYSRTLPLPGGTRVGAELREVGSSALDRRTTWAAPDPSTLVLDPWGAPAASAVIRTLHAPWPVPDASMRVDMPPPAAFVGGVVTNLVEPFHPIEMPDLGAAQRVAIDDDPVFGQPLRPPTLAEAAELLVIAPAPTDRSGVSHRIALGLAAAAGAVCAAVAAAITLL